MVAPQLPLATATPRTATHIQERAKSTGNGSGEAVSGKHSRATKQTKLLGYQMRLLRPWNNLVVGGVIEELTQLGHLLGRVHDLVFLADRLRLERGESHWGKQDDELLNLIESSEAELQRDGIEIAERFFAERPSEFGLHFDEWF